MSVKEVTYYTVICDECGVSAFEGQEFTAWSDADGAIWAVAESLEWSEDNGQHRCSKHNPFCENCGKDAGEFCGERDFLCPVCFATEDA